MARFGWPASASALIPVVSSGIEVTVASSASPIQPPVIPVLPAMTSPKRDRRVPARPISSAHSPNCSHANDALMQHAPA
jgi:hypothetical protein